MAPEIRLDKWKDLYSKRALALKSSVIRDLFIVASRPDIISFAGGMPDTRSLPMNLIADATRRVLEREGAAALQYGSSDGHLGLRERIASLMKDDGMVVDVEEIIVTDGGQQALDFLGKILINPGDEIIVEGPSYVGAIQAFSSYQARFLSVPLDDDGIQIEPLEKLLKDLKEAGKRPKFLYLVPAFHNPAGVTLALERRRRIVEMAREHSLLVIEDNPYDQLRFDGEPLATLRSMDDSIVYMSTFSKIFSPGVRLGWIAAPKPILEKLNFAKQAANLCSSSFSQRVVEEYFNTCPWEKYLKKQTDLYKERRNVMLSALEEFFPSEARWTRPMGGLFLWVTLPDYINTSEMLAESIDQAKVAYVPGEAFFTDGSGKNSMRLNFSYPHKESIREGIERLGDLIKSQMRLYETFTKKLKIDEDKKR
ncbi:MAG: PLP-dependent aminotransferase family protein [Actinomycetota bacterium]|nr:PLP-dependent aminotransferase family protein [Actinomycetota bacterium]